MWSQVKKILLTRGLSTIVDDEDYEYLCKNKWHAHNRRGKYYAARGIRVGGKAVSISMHRVILSAQPGQMVDHINGDSLDNRKENLRFATTTENNWNAKRRKDNKSGHKGVSWRADRQMWIAQLQHNKKYIHLGYHNTSTEAADAYLNAAHKYFGEYAKT